MSHSDIDVAGSTVPLVMRVLETLKRQLEEAKTRSEPSNGDAGGSVGVPAPIYSIVAAPFVALGVQFMQTAFQHPYAPL